MNTISKISHCGGYVVAIFSDQKSPHLCVGVGSRFAAGAAQGNPNPEHMILLDEGVDIADAMNILEFARLWVNKDRFYDISPDSSVSDFREAMEEHEELKEMEGVPGFGMF